MPRMKDCRECEANNIKPEDWDYASDGPYPIFTPRQQRREHTYCGIRMGGGAGGSRFALQHMVWRPNGEYVGTLIHKGGK